MLKNVTIDVYGVDQDLLANRDYLFRLLQKLPTRLGMELVAGPWVEDIQQVTDPRDAGLSGAVIIATSHITFHSWPPDGMINIDICSCKDFDTDLVLEHLALLFDSSDIEYQEYIRARRQTRHPISQRASATI